MKIWTIHEKKEEKLLRKKLEPFDFSKYNKKEIAQLISDMRKTMKEALGVGLAANQVGNDESMFVSHCEGKWYALFNPKIIKAIGGKVEMDEGCLSVPGLRGTTKRYEKIVVEGVSGRGKKVKIKAWGLLAHIFQHEIDHLNGILYIDHAKRIEKLEPQPEQ